MNRLELVDESPSLDTWSASAQHDTGTQNRFRTQVAVRSTAVVVAAIGLLYTAYWRLGTAAIIYDEPTYAKAGWAYLHGSFAENQEHPPLGKYVFGLGELLFGRGITGSRIAAATCGVAIGILLFFFAKSLAGFWAGMIAAGMWIVLPRAVGSGYGAIPEHLDRFAMLDVVMATFAIGGIYLGWTWLTSGSWPRALGTGLVLGLAVASKEPAAILVLVIAVMGVAHFQTRRALYQGIALGGIGLLTFGATYLPFGTTAFHAWRYMFQFQSNQYGVGHAVFLAGRIYPTAPWWTALYYQWVQNGPWVMTALIVSCVAAVVLLRDWRVWYLIATTVAPMILVMTSPIVLPHYVFDWLPQLLVLAALGVVALLRRSGIWTAVGVTVLVVVAVAGAGFLTTLTTLQPKGYARLSEVINPARRSLVVVDGPTYIVKYYLPHARITQGLPGAGSTVTAIILGNDPRSPALKEQRFTDRARALGLRDIRLNDIDVWVRPSDLGPLPGRAG